MRTGQSFIAASVLSKRHPWRLQEETGDFAEPEQNRSEPVRDVLWLVEDFV
jgi:hypothetical protein